MSPGHVEEVESLCPLIFSSPLPGQCLAIFSAIFLFKSISKSSMGSKSICRMRRTCHFYDNLINSYYKQMRNVIRIERLGFSIMLPDATDWKNVVIITNQFHNTYYGLPSNFQVDDLCRLQIRTLDLCVADVIPILLEGVLRALDGRVRVRELECKMSSYSEEMFEYIMTKIRPLEVCLNWPARGPVPCRDFLRSRALESVARLELMSSVDNLDLSRCHPSLLHLKIQNYRVDDAAECENLLLQVTEAMEKTNLFRIHITITPYTTTSSRCWIELKSDRCILYSIIGSGSAVTIYSIREKVEQLADLEKIKMEIDECIRVRKEPPYDKIDADRDEHEDTILSHYTTFSEESFNCSSISSDRSILSDSLSS